MYEVIMYTERNETCTRANESEVCVTLAFTQLIHDENELIETVH